MEAGAEECILLGAGASSSCLFSLSDNGECATPLSLARSAPFSSAKRSRAEFRSASWFYNILELTYLEAYIVHFTG